MTDLLPGDAPAAPASGAPATPSPAQSGAPAAAPAAGTPPGGGTTPADTLAPDPNKAFLQTLPEDLRENASLGRYSSPEALARAYVNLERTLGSEKVPIPKDPNDKEGWDRYYAAGGRPAEPSLYQFERPKEMPPGVVWDEDMEGWWKQTAHSAGLSQKQAADMVVQYRDRFIAQTDAGNKADQRAETDRKSVLTRDWGSTYEAKRQLANAAFAEMPAPLQEAMLRAKLNLMPEFAKWLVDQKTAMTGETSPRPAGDSALASPEAIQQQISEFRERNRVALADHAHPDHARLLRELTDLHNRLYPATTAA